MINSIKIFHECVCVSEYSLFLFLFLTTVCFPPHTNKHIHREFSFLQDCGNENSFFIPQINFLGESENRNSFGINLTCGLLGRDAFSEVNQLFYILKEWSLSQKKCFSLTNIPQDITLMNPLFAIPLHFTFHHNRYKCFHINKVGR